MTGGPSKTMTVSVPRPQLTRDELLQLKWLLGGVLTLLGVATVAYMDVDAWWLMALTAGAAIATVLWPTLPARVPRLVHVLAFPFIAAFFALDLWFQAELLPAMVRLDMLLLLYRAVVYRQRRDDLQVIVLGLFLVVVAGVITVSLAFAAQILIYTACALLFLLVITLVDSNPVVKLAETAANGAKETAAAASARGTVPLWAQHAHWPRLLRRVAAVAEWRVIALSVGLFVGVIGVSALLFLLIPRFQLENGMFLDRFITKKARTGFSDSIKFGDVTEIQQDTSVALHVDVNEPGQIPAAPYWRMIVLDEYENGTFRMSAALRSRFERERAGVTIDGGARRRQSRGIWTFYLEAGVSRHLPLLGGFQRLRFGESQNYQVAPRLGLVALTKDPVTMTAYQVEGFDLASPLHDSSTDLYLALPASIRSHTPEAAQEAATLQRLDREAVGAEGLRPAEFSAKLCSWLRTRHTYSLSPRVPAGPGDPLVRWADSREPGHCELFAGSFVLLARAAGYPARVITGFRGGSWNAYATNSFTVRNSDAHAWAEIYDATMQSWLRADPLELPANAQNADSAAAETLAHRTDRTWAARLDSLRVFWYRRIVSFDQQAQVTTLKAAKEAAQNSVQRLRDWLHSAVIRMKTWWRTPWDAGRIASVVTLSLVAAVFTWLWRRVRLAVRTWLLRDSARREDPIRREAGRWLLRLRPGADEPVRPLPLVSDLQRIRFGARATWPDAATVFGHARRMVRERRGAR